MPRYRYIAATAGKAGEEVEVEADSITEAAAKLRSCGMTPVRCCGEANEVPAGIRRVFGGRKADICEFTGQLSPLLAANIPLERALAIIAEGAASDELRQLALTLRQGLHEGKKFSDLIRSYGPLFPGFYSNLIETGEETGCLPEVVEELRGFLNESRELREFIVSSSIYPCVVLGITILVGVLMFTVFIPQFARIFVDMGREQPGSMVFLMTVSDILKYAWWGVPLGAVLLWYGLRWHYGEARLKQWRARAAVRAPVLGSLNVQLEMGRFLRTLAILISNHVDIIRTVRIAVRVIQNEVIRDSFSRLEARLRGGEKLSAGFQGNSYVPPGLASKIRVGEETGAVGMMLTRCAADLEDGTRRRIKRLLSLFEPVVIVFLAGMVLVVVVSIFMAIMELNEVG